MKKYMLGAVAIAAALTLASCSSQAPTEEAAAPESPSAAAPAETEAAPVETEAAEPSMEPKDCWTVAVPDASFYITDVMEHEDGDVTCTLQARGNQVSAGKAWIEQLIAEDGWTAFPGDTNAEGNPGGSAYKGSNTVSWGTSGDEGDTAPENWTLFTYFVGE